MKKLIIVGGLLTILLLSVNAVLSYVNVRQLNKDGSSIMESYRVIDGVEDIVTFVREAESIQRAMLLTGCDDRWPNHYQQAVKNAHRKVDRLGRFRGEYDGWPEQLSSLDGKLTALDERLKRTVSVRQEKGINAATEIVVEGTTRKMIDDIIESCKNLVKGEQELLKERKKQAVAVYSVAVLTGLIGSVGGIAVLVFVGFLIYKHHREHVAAAAHRKRVLNSLAVLVGELDDEGRIMYANESALESIGVTLADVKGKRPDETYWLSHSEEVRESIRDAIERGLRGEESRFDTTIKVADRVIDIDFHLVPLKGKDGTVTGLVPSAIDITQRKQFEKRLLEEEKHKNEFLATLAHELRNPMAPLVNAVQLMKLKPHDTASVGPMIERQVTHMVRLVDDLLDVSRISRGKLDLKRRKMNVLESVNTAIETCRTLIEKSEHALSVHLSTDPVIVFGDDVRLTQIVTNLLNNAAKYTPPGGRIDVSVHSTSREAVITVSDNGIGIPDDQRQRIFEMFAQVDREQTSKGGLGIGLTLVKRLAEMHGGTIETGPGDEGAGSKFVVRLPLASPDDESNDVRMSIRPRQEEALCS